MNISLLPSFLFHPRAKGQGLGALLVLRGEACSSASWAHTWMEMDQKYVKLGVAVPHLFLYFIVEA